MRLRVVWGLGETMATFWPTRVLTNVDLPALGRPTMAMNPDWKGTWAFYAKMEARSGTGLVKQAGREIEQRFRAHGDARLFTAARHGNRQRQMEIFDSLWATLTGSTNPLAQDDRIAGWRERKCRFPVRIADDGENGKSRRLSG